MHNLSFVTRVSQWNSVFLRHMELSRPLWYEVSSLLRDTTGSERADNAAISLCMD
jgi:hypothetical protein